MSSSEAPSSLLGSHCALTRSLSHCPKLFHLNSIFFTNLLLIRCADEHKRPVAATQLGKRCSLGPHEALYSRRYCRNFFHLDFKMEWHTLLSIMLRIAEKFKSAAAVTRNQNFKDVSGHLRPPLGRGARRSKRRRRSRRGQRRLAASFQDRLPLRRLHSLPRQGHGNLVSDRPKHASAGLFGRRFG